MKNLFLLIAMVGILTTACQSGAIDNDNTHSSTGQPDENGDNTLKTVTCATNEILYKTKYGYTITLNQESGFGGKLMSNTYEDGIGRLTFDNDVSNIACASFMNCTSLVEVKFSDIVTLIEEYAFAECTSLASITIPDSVTLIGGNAFYGCTSLTRVDITDLSAWCKIGFSISSANPLYNGAKLYLNGGELTDITIPSDITSIENYAFNGCSSLTSITIPNSVTSIGSYAFLDCSSLTSVTIPDSVTSIGHFAFRDCTSLTSVTIPDSVTLIGGAAFYGCTSLTSVTIPDSVTWIGGSAFRDCNSLTSVYCKPATPPTGGDSMFDNNASGRTIYVPRDSVEAYKTDDHWGYYANDIVGY